MVSSSRLVMSLSETRVAKNSHTSAFVLESRLKTSKAVLSRCRLTKTRIAVELRPYCTVICRGHLRI